MCMHDNVMVVIHFLVVVYDNVGELSYGISSWSANTRYSVSMLTEGTKVDPLTSLPYIQYYWSWLTK